MRKKHFDRKLYWEAKLSSKERKKFVQFVSVFMKYNNETVSLSYQFDSNSIQYEYNFIVLNISS